MIYHRGITTIEAAANSDEELAFLLAIARDYSDPVPKLIYAEWLEDQIVPHKSDFGSASERTRRIKPWAGVFKTFSPPRPHSSKIIQNRCIAAGWPRRG